MIFEPEDQAQKGILNLNMYLPKYLGKHNVKKIKILT